MDPQDDLNEGFSGGHGADDDDDHIFESCDNKIQNASWADHIAPANLAPIRTRRLDPQDDEDEAAEVGEYDDDDDDDDDDESGNSMAMEGVVRNGGHIIIHASASASASCGSPFSSHESIRRRFLLSLARTSSSSSTTNQPHIHMMDASILNRLNISPASISSLPHRVASSTFKPISTLSEDQQYRLSAACMDHQQQHHHHQHLNGCIHNDDDAHDDHHINGPCKSDDNHTHPDHHLYIAATDEYNTMIGKPKTLMSVTSSPGAVATAQISSSSSRLGSSSESSSRLSHHNYSTTTAANNNNNNNFFTRLRRFVSDCSGHVTNSCPRGAKRLLLCCLYCRHRGRPKKTKTSGNTKILRRRRSNNYTVGYSPIFGSFPVGITINSPSATHNNSINISSSSPGSSLSSRSSVVVSSSSLHVNHHNYGSGGTLISPRRDHSIQSNYNHSSAASASASMPSPSPSPRLVRRDSSGNNSSMTVKRGIGRGVMGPNIPNTYSYNSNNSKNHRLGWITFRHNHRDMMVMDGNSDPTSPTVTCIGKIRREVGQCKKSGDHISDFGYNAKKNGKENIMKCSSNHVNDDHHIIAYSSTHNNGHDVYLL